jgi:hypothetical protein
MVTEEMLEGAIILLKTCGENLENSTYIEETEEAFGKLGDIIERVSPRLKCLINNLHNLRQNCWIEEIEGPCISRVCVKWTDVARTPSSTVQSAIGCIHGEDEYGG